MLEEQILKTVIDKAFKDFQNIASTEELSEAMTFGTKFSYSEDGWKITGYSYKDVYFITEEGQCK